MGNKIVTVIPLVKGFCIRVGGSQVAYFDTVEEGRSEIDRLLMSRIMTSEQHGEARGLLRKLQHRQQESLFRAQYDRAARQRSGGQRVA